MLKEVDTEPHTNTAFTSVRMIFYTRENIVNKYFNQRTFQKVFNMFNPGCTSTVLTELEIIYKCEHWPQP